MHFLVDRGRKLRRKNNPIYQIPTISLILNFKTALYKSYLVMSNTIAPTKKKFIHSKMGNQSYACLKFYNSTETSVGKIPLFPNRTLYHQTQACKGFVSAYSQSCTPNVLSTF